jgi:hypothetical protein
MYNCSDDVLAYHNDEVTLSQEERDEMRERRDTNRKRLKEGLKKASKPAPLEFKSQGSYAMKTMVQDPDKDYDIDDGVYFSKDDLKGPYGGEMTALEARQMVHDALDDGSFKKPPEVREKCVRIYYDAGYHVDMPVYRRVGTRDSSNKESIHYELAGADWTRSDAREVTTWFEDENNKQSPDTTNGRQLRRITREIKKLARSRSTWKTQILSGFGITKLVTESFKGNSAREDAALYDTMEAIRDRLNGSLVVEHPVTPDEKITKGDNDPKARFLRDKLSDALVWFKPLFDESCTKEKALDCWDTVYNTDYFSNRIEKNKAEEAASVGLTILPSGLLKSTGSSVAVQAAVHKEGGGRYA